MTAGLDRNNKSWSLEFHDDRYAAQYSDDDTDMHLHPSGSDDDDDDDDDDRHDDDGDDYDDDDDRYDDMDRDDYDDYDDDFGEDVDGHDRDDYDDMDWDDYDVDDDDRYIAWYNGRKTVIRLPTSCIDDDDDDDSLNDSDRSTPRPTHSIRVGVYLDRPAGSLSFYRVFKEEDYPDTLTHIHTFHTTFTQEDLLPGFGFELMSSGSSVSLCRL